jgi:hypothetical protein
MVCHPDLSITCFSSGKLREITIANVPLVLMIGRTPIDRRYPLQSEDRFDAAWRASLLRGGRESSGPEQLATGDAGKASSDKYRTRVGLLYLLYSDYRYLFQRRPAIPCVGLAFADGLILLNGRARRRRTGEVFRINFVHFREVIDVI